MLVSLIHIELLCSCHLSQLDSYTVGGDNYIELNLNYEHFTHNVLGSLGLHFNENRNGFMED